MQEAWHLASEAYRCSTSKFWRLFPARRCSLGSGRGGLLLGNLHGVSVGRGTPRHNADYTIEFARVFRGSFPNAASSFLSGNGADPTGRSRVAFARYKGEAENALPAMGFPHVYLFLPAYIYPGEPRKEPNFNYRLLRLIYRVFRLLFPNQVIRPMTWPGSWWMSPSAGQTRAEARFSRTARSEPWRYASPPQVESMQEPERRASFGRDY